MLVEHNQRTAKLWAHPVDGVIAVNSTIGRPWPGAVHRTGRAPLMFWPTNAPGESPFRRNAEPPTAC